MLTIKVTCKKTGEEYEYDYPDTDRGRIQRDNHKEALERLQDCNSFTVEVKD